MSEQKTPMQQYADRLAEWDKENLRSLLAAKWGLGFLWRLLEDCYVFGEPSVFDSVNATFFNLGKQAVGKGLMTKILDINPDAYLEMTKISKKEAKNAKAATELEAKMRSEE